MPILPPSKETPSPQPRASLVRGIVRAAGEMNPYLAIFAIGLAVLDFTCYAGMAMTREPSLLATATQAMYPAAQPAPAPAAHRAPHR